MKRETIGIFVVTLLIATALPAVGSNNINKNQVEERENYNYNDQKYSDSLSDCGQAYVILRGNNETAKIGAIVRFYAPIICWVIRNERVFSDVEVINQTNPSKPGYGEYCAIFDGCGCYQAKMLKNKGWCGRNEPWIIIANYQITITEIYLKDDCKVKVRSQSRNLQQPSSLILQGFLEKFIDHFPLLARLL